MPGLLRGMARTAAVAGTATAVSNRVSRRQAARWQQQGYAGQDEGYDAPAPAPAAPAAPAPDPIAQLKELAIGSGAAGAGSCAYPPPGSPPWS